LLYRTVKKQQTHPERCRSWFVRNSSLPLLVCLIWTSLLVQSVYGEQSKVSEYDLKAVYLYNFLHFVHWPEENNIQDNLEPKVIAVIGNSQFGDSLKKLQAKLQKTGKNNIIINYLGPYRKGMNLSRCHLLFISASEKKNFAEIIAALKNSPVLTVSDVDGFLTAGGMITLVTRKNKIRWKVNRTKVDLAGLRLSAKLLDIALMVVEIPEHAVSD